MRKRKKNKKVEKNCKNKQIKKNVKKDNKNNQGANVKNKKNEKKYYYAVFGGRQGNKIYKTWEEAERNIKGISGVKFKKFETHTQAKNFINEEYKKKNPEKQPTLAELREKSGRSKGERWVETFLKSMNIKYVMEYDTFECYRAETHQILPYDFELPEYKILIEVQGDQHLKFSPGFHRDLMDFDDQRKRDTLKKKNAIDNGYKLLELFPQDFKEPYAYKNKILNTIANIIKQGAYK